MKPLKVAVLGAGNGGQAIAGWMASQGCEVGITDLFPQYLAPLHTLGGAELSGVVTAKGAFTVHDDPAECVRGADVLVLVTAAPGHKEILEKIAPAISDGQVLIASPGNWAHLTIPTYLRTMGYEPDLIYAETDSLIYACRASAPGKVSVGYVKDELGLGVWPKTETPRVLEMMKPYYPQLKDRGNIFKITLDNVNYSLHPSVLLLNAGWAENAKGDWIFYRQGPTPGIIRVIEGIDSERLALGQAAGVKLSSVYDLLKSYYTVPGQKDLLSLLNLNSAYKDIKAPSTIHYRYFTEDVPYGLVPIRHLCRVFGLATPVIDAVIQLVSTLLGEDFESHGLCLKDLGLEGISREELRRRMKE